MRSKDLRAQRAKIVADARALTAGESMTAEQQTQFDAMMAEVDTIAANIERVERAEREFLALGSEVAAVADATGQTITAVVDQREVERAREQRIIRAVLLGKPDGLSDPDRQHLAQRRVQNAASVGTTTSGGYIVAPLFVRELLVAMKLQGGMREAARGISTDTGAVLPWPTMDDRTQVATILGENTALGSDTDLVFGSTSINAWKYKSGVLLVSVELLQDSAFDFDTVIKNAISGRFVRGQNAHFTTGTGTGQPRGLLTAATLGYTMPTGNTTSVSFDGILELIHSVDPYYRTGGRFMFHDSTLKSLRQIKDGYGRYLWQPGTTVGAPDTIWNYPYSINQDFPVMAANAVPIAFGDFQNYIIRDVLDLQIVVLRERYADSLQVGYLAYMRSDGNLISAAQPIKTLKNSAT